MQVLFENLEIGDKFIENDHEYVKVCGNAAELYTDNEPTGQLLRYLVPITSHLKTSLYYGHVVV